MSAAGSTTLLHRSSAEVAAALAEARERTLWLIDGIAPHELDRVHSTLMSPLAWDLGHIAAFEDLWLAQIAAGEELLHPELAEVYDAFETPRAGRGDLPYLRGTECIDYLRQVRDRSLALLERDGPGDGWLHEMVVQHELQHNETMLQTIELARFEDHAPTRRPAPAPPPPGPPTSGFDLVTVPAGEFELGAAGDRFSYDNERPRQRWHVDEFRIGRVPVTNADYEPFVAEGGYRDPQWWTEDGWAWVQTERATMPRNWTADGREWRIGGFVERDPQAPVIHVSWFEADAFARATGHRLPTEFEWEKAATFDPATGVTRTYPWGDEQPDPTRANVDQRALGPVRVGSHPEGASPCGCLGMIGDVWEWTSTVFDGYPGFRAHPYPEYSEVFFQAGYRVLRGGSWATCGRVASPTFRNWDFPQRRQIFSGFRLAESRNA